MANATSARVSLGWLSYHGNEGKSHSTVKPQPGSASGQMQRLDCPRTHKPNKTHTLNLCCMQIHRDMQRHYLTPLGAVPLGYLLHMVFVVIAELSASTTITLHSLKRMKHHCNYILYNCNSKCHLWCLSQSTMAFSRILCNDFGVIISVSLVGALFSYKLIPPTGLPKLKWTIYCRKT